MIDQKKISQLRFPSIRALIINWLVVFALFFMGTGNQAHGQVEINHGHLSQSTYNVSYGGSQITRINFESGIINYITVESNLPPNPWDEEEKPNQWEEPKPWDVGKRNEVYELAVSFAKDTRLTKVSNLELPNLVLELPVKQKKNIQMVVGLKNGTAAVPCAGSSIDVAFSIMWVVIYKDNNGELKYLVKTKITSGQNDFDFENETYHLSFDRDAFSIDENGAKIKCADDTQCINIDIKSKILAYPIILEGSYADLAPDGSIKFKSLRCTNGLNHTFDNKVQVNYGDFVLDEFIIGDHWGSDLAAKEILFNGEALYDGMFFKQKGSFKPHLSQDRITFNYKKLQYYSALLSPMDGYGADINSGNMYYQTIPKKAAQLRNSGKPVYSRANFNITLLLPDNIKKIGQSNPGGRIIIKDVNLINENQKGYTATIDLHSVEINNNFSITPLNGNTVVFFNSLTDKSQNRIEITKDCQTTLSNYREKEIYKIPGATIYNGDLQFKLKQVEDVEGLHTLIWGFLNLHSNGIYGKITSTAYSVVPINSLNKVSDYKKKYTSLNEILLSYDSVALNENITRIDQKIRENNDTKKAFAPDDIRVDILNAQKISLNKKKDKYSYYLDQLKQGMEVKPLEPEILFYMDGLQIMDMKIDSLVFCQGVLEFSNFIYDVHFPYPTYTDIKFADNTLNKKNIGYFDKSFGPLYALSNVVENNSLDESGSTGQATGQDESGDLFFFGSKTPTWDIVGNMFWFWRLPFNIPQNKAWIEFRPDEEPKILLEKCYLETPLLFSKDLGLESKIRLYKNGTLELMGHDTVPSFGKNRTIDYETNSVKFNLVDLTQLPQVRERDFYWTGEVNLPFFGFIPFSFNIRNLNPYLTSYNVLENKHTSYCDEYRNLYVKTNPVQYSFKDDKFESPGTLCVYSMGTDENVTIDSSSKSLLIASYTNAKCLLDGGNSRLILPELKSEYNTPCSDKKLIQYLANYSLSNENFDLIEYDSEAFDQRGIITCEQSLYHGDYAILEIDNESGEETTKLYMPGASFYWDTISGGFNIETDDKINYLGDKKEDKGALNIPGATIINNENRLIFSLGMPVSSDVGGSIPYSAYIQFCMDKNCGYFWFYGEGAFTYIFKFDAFIFLVHSPIQLLEENISQGINPLNNIRQHLHYGNTGRLKDRLFGPNADSSLLITGVMIGGDISFPIQILDVSVGCGVWTFHKGELLSPDSLRIGLNINGSAALDVIVLKAKASLSLAGTFQAFSNPDIELSGDAYLCLIESILIGHLKQEFRGWVDFSNKDGFDFGGSVKLGKGWGPGRCKN